jgi:precorrin-2/cobalt-factor-2 C20-methyltransferase
MAEQRIVRDIAELSERGDCFAMLIVTRGARGGLLTGDAEHALLEALPRLEERL